jgi:hypothetical protein
LQRKKRRNEQAAAFAEAIPLCEDALQTDLNDAQKTSICVQLGNCYVQTKQVGCLCQMTALYQ